MADKVEFVSDEEIPMVESVKSSLDISASRSIKYDKFTIDLWISTELAPENPFYKAEVLRVKTLNAVPTELLRTPLT
ncbi:hypothetical protein P5673_022438 [Acropora cervicornis]|uniref:Uncharacterized protein n=1 Tax=Acropora cervicornis TaxID=6130 RepID=A0AAD9V005_ACRCE|nr:hypothetical protein P5673_022438 [Acropora cervicornis]